MTVQSTQTFPDLHCYETINVSPASTPSIEEVQGKISVCFQKASEESSLIAKRSAYNEAFAILRASSSPELRPTLFRLLEQYAMETCYAQESEVVNSSGKSVDDELGFRMCARLMELSFRLQMNDLDLLKCDYDWSQHSSLETLIQDLQTAPTQKGLFFDSIDQAMVDTDVLVRKAQEKELQEIMAKTLRSLTFSYQNITALSTSAQYALHRKLQDWTEALIGKETVQQRRQLAEYLYNRCAFMLELQNASWETQVQSYDPVTKAFEESYSADDPQLIKKKAQISNIQGCIIARSGQQDAEPYFQKAYELHSSIPRDKFLIGNVITGLISCLTSRALDEQGAMRLAKYAMELGIIIGDFQKEGNRHCYVMEYPRSVMKALEALTAYKAQHP